MAVCSEIHTKHINTLCGQNVELLTVKLAVYIVTTGMYTLATSGGLSLHGVIASSNCGVARRSAGLKGICAYI
jgi:hypothetical protein